MRYVIIIITISPLVLALGRAVEYAMTLEKFPQACMNADRRSAYYATFDAKGYEDALNYEWENGRPIISKESVAGRRFLFLIRVIPRFFQELLDSLEALAGTEASI